MRNSNAVPGSAFVTTAAHWYPGPKSRSYLAPTDGLPLDRIVHHSSSIAGSLMARYTRDGSAAIGKSCRMSYMSFTPDGCGPYHHVGTGRFFQCQLARRTALNVTCV